MSYSEHVLISAIDNYRMDKESAKATYKFNNPNGNNIYPGLDGSLPVLSE